ncbi:MAG TPA: hypothetical protein VMU99_06285 [Acidimicrobiales bacterium]|nr:hypothetical protein [Acidimicrobiales bacterium]
MTQRNHSEQLETNQNSFRSHHHLARFVAGIIAISSLFAGISVATKAPADVIHRTVTPAVSAHRSVPKGLAPKSAGNFAFQNVAPQPDFLATCSQSSSSDSCISSEIAAIDRARHLEGVASVKINPVTFTKLTPAEQIFAIVNLERVPRGLPPVVALSEQLNSFATRGVQSSTDPVMNGWSLPGGAKVTGWASVWAGGINVLGADYMWMYSEGIGANIDCTSASSAGCWGNRRNILVADLNPTSCAGYGGNPQLMMGASLNPTAYNGSTGLGEIIAEVCGAASGSAAPTWASLKHQLIHTAPAHALLAKSRP